MGGFSKNIQLSYSTKNITFRPQIERHHRQFIRKTAKKALIISFWKALTKKSHLYILAPKAVLEKLEGQPAKNGYLKIAQRLTFCVGRGSNP